MYARACRRWESVWACILLFTESEEFGLHRGLDLIPGRVRRIPESVTRAAHGLESTASAQAGSACLTGVRVRSFVYFVHSYYVEPQSQDVTLATTDYGIDFAAIVHENNIWATQFHPEKSQQVGERLLDNFARL